MKGVIDGWLIKRISRLSIAWAEIKDYHDQKPHRAPASGRWNPHGQPRSGCSLPAAASPLPPKVSPSPEASVPPPSQPTHPARLGQPRRTGIQPVISLTVPKPPIRSTASRDGASVPPRQIRSRHNQLRMMKRRWARTERISRLQARFFRRHHRLCLRRHLLPRCGGSHGDGHASSGDAGPFPGT